MAKTRRVLLDLGSRLRRSVRSSIATRLSVNLVVIIALSGLLFTLVGVETISNLIVTFLAGIIGPHDHPTFVISEVKDIQAFI